MKSWKFRSPSRRPFTALLAGPLLAGPFLALPLLLVPGGPATGQSSAPQVRITFQPDCFRGSLDAPCDKRKTDDRLDLGPQIAIWIERPNGDFVDTVLVTNLTARLGIGNRPGHVTLPSGPKFPYGRRPMSLPVWAHRRGKLYDALVMQDGLDREYWLGFHEVASSPDPYFCRPMTLQEIDVDAISCPTSRFNSVKGRFFDPSTDAVAPHLRPDGSPKDYVPRPKSYYPPRNDLRSFVENDCDRTRGPMCTISAKQFADLNDLDMVAAATPPYGAPYSRVWRVPDALPDGDYVVFVEVSKEFDRNARHSYPASIDPMLREWGVGTNFGQPSVVWKVPFRLERARASSAATTQIAGYGDWDGKSGQLHPPDDTISEAPGSGVGRLLVVSQPAAGGGQVQGRVHVAFEPAGAPPPMDGGGQGGAGGGGGGAGGTVADGGVDRPGCLGGEITTIQVSPSKVMAEGAEVTFMELTGDAWQRAGGYDVRVWNGKEQNQNAFNEGLPIPPVAKGTPGGQLTVTVPDLRAESDYTVGVRPVGDCFEPHTGFASFRTVVREFTQLSGCFVATAAYGSALAADVAALRRARDQARAASPLAAAADDAYARSSPPVAEVLRGSEAARAVARRLLAPLVGLLRLR